MEADLRAAADPDQGIAALGRAGIGNWLEVSAATTWQPLPPEQQARLAELLPRANLVDHRARTLAFHAGIELPSAEQTHSSEDTAEPGASKPRRWAPARTPTMNEKPALIGTGSFCGRGSRKPT